MKNTTIIVLALILVAAVAVYYASRPPADSRPGGPGQGMAGWTGGEV